jgi:hypothetical protein
VIKVTAAGKAPWQVVHHASSDASYDVWLVDTEAPTVRARADSARPPRRSGASTTRRKQAKKPPSALHNLDF